MVIYGLFPLFRPTLCVPFPLTPSHAKKLQTSMMVQTLLTQDLEKRPKLMRMRTIKRKLTEQYADFEMIIIITKIIFVRIQVL